ncbi:KpsF/GutQ family sugar-phosphate isomerase [Synechococcus elongatus]|uniref:KpsF/GutQ family protein n=2 Tax=Synechococcus elongatus TaxID=32046 RepID=Q31KU8_SYNE7|nr:KpsF/GutQ family sugar-phosphate isomerase [Synechococcus elongatus]ABB58321.1 KpsF/GutQ family protein [Synechococcus elongatus PCC 7942 = FACHB-805]AJD57213.1 hypothetical protein M744_04845 [Synechococcus elongatus UTEX 2973]MBD2587044.1 KpsF/GutQ family sugar-phosphate isomerase [Synechococcus elongatus FACHB-242]MBD2688115.1 KpsF/GutQ family sugar-phosphate isomerase [Synechococcus elongatus FACHB-1061]MBD2706174.1 KpsF/GutQ family sugar-phosphate isomerase [Synechococcus elongatus PCC
MAPLLFRQILDLEAEAIQRAAERADAEAFANATQLIANCSGKVVLSGVGKSGIIARKITATLLSIGTLSAFLHPCDALHGDLGIVTEQDVVVMLSNSGETDELLAMLPHLQRRQVPIIAIVGNMRSTLARVAAAVLDASVDREACPLNLAPTASTTVALAIGDALAAQVMDYRSVTSEQFAFNHPAGRLGKRLTLKVVDVMHQGEELPLLPPEARFVEVVTAISRGGLGAVPIVEADGRLLGLITDGDLRRLLEQTSPAKLDQITAAEFMTPQPIAVEGDLLAYDALHLMENRPSQISVLPVVDAAQRCLGLVRIHDLIRSGI